MFLNFNFYLLFFRHLFCNFYNYLLSDLKRSDNKSKIEQKSKSISKYELEIENINDKIKQIDDKIEGEDDRSKEMYASLSQDKDFRANEMFDKDIKKAENDLSYANEKTREFNRKVLEFKESIKFLEDIDKKFYQELNKINFTAQARINHIICRILILILAKDLSILLNFQNILKILPF